MRLRPLALPPVFLAVVLMAPGACGQSSKSNAGDFQGTEKDVAETVFDFRDAVAKRDEAKVCDAFFTARLRDEITAKAKEADRGSTCAKAIEDSLQDIDATDITIEKGGISITGTTATVKYKTDLTTCDDVVAELTLANERGWRISKLPRAAAPAKNC
jgi:hypothetical protein